MTSKPQQPRRLPSGFYSKLQFWNQWLPLIKMSYSLSYSENFHFSNLLAASEAGCWKLKNESFPNKAIYSSFEELRYSLFITFNSLADPHKRGHTKYLVAVTKSVRILTKIDENFRFLRNIQPHQSRKSTQSFQRKFRLVANNFACSEICMLVALGF